MYIKSISDFNSVAIKSYQVSQSPEISTQRKTLLNTKPETLNQSRDNKPFNGMSFFVESDALPSKDVAQYLDFLEKDHFKIIFEHLNFLGVKDDISVEELKEFIKTKTTPSTQLHFNLMTQTFSSYKQLFQSVREMNQMDKVNAQHIHRLNCILDALKNIRDWNHKLFFIVCIPLVISENIRHFVFEIPMVLDEKYVPDIFLAMPVWYYFFRFNNRQLNFFNAFPSLGQNFKTFLKLYNPNGSRVQDIFPKIDPIPSDWNHIAEYCRLNEYFFNFIATPYHHAVKDRVTPMQHSIPRIDPIHLGMIEGVPYITIFKRWSRNGMFPEIPHMIANTIEHLKSTPPFYQTSEANTQFVNDLIRAFEHKQVFKFLKE